MESKTFRIDMSRQMSKKPFDLFISISSIISISHAVLMADKSAHSQWADVLFFFQSNANMKHL